MNASEMAENVVRWCGEHGKFTAVVIALAVGVLFGVLLFR